jgi:hypothetical protein
MGWKAAEKLIRHWKILRGDNVRDLSVSSTPSLFAPPPPACLALERSQKILCFFGAR